MSKNPVVQAYIEKIRAEDPVLNLLLDEIKANMDVQIQIATLELEETKRLKAEIDERLAVGYVDKWAEYETMTRDAAYHRIRRRTEKPVEEQYDAIAAEG